MVNRKDLRAGIEKMREVAQLLSGWADDMEASLAKKNSRKAAEEAPAAVSEAPVEQPAAAPAEPSPPTFEQVRGLLAGKSAAGYRTQVLALIRSYGAEKLSGVDPSHFGELVEAVNRLGDSDAG